MSRTIPRWLLPLLFIVVPAVEIYVLIQVGQVIGAGWTVLLLLADAFLGSYLVRHEGARVWRALREALEAHRMPARELADGALVLIGGTLLVTPGFVSDVLGLFCVLPGTRPLARRALTGFIARRFLADGRTRRRPGPDSVVQGEVVD